MLSVTWKSSKKPRGAETSLTGYIGKREVIIIHTERNHRRELFIHIYLKKGNTRIKRIDMEGTRLAKCKAIAEAAYPILFPS